MILFTSDTHFHHANVIKHCNRPWGDVDAMNQGLIERWNATVGPNDEVYHLGDFSFQNNPDRLVEQLSGQITFVFGNHDSKSLRRRLQGAGYGGHEILKLRHNKRRYILCHYPLLSWDQMWNGSVMLHGHCHGGIQHLNEGLRRFDVGVDVWDYRPVSIDEIDALADAVGPSPRPRRAR